jgi:hypothetical protein
MRNKSLLAEEGSGTGSGCSGRERSDGRHSGGSAGVALHSDW